MDSVIAFILSKEIRSSSELSSPTLCSSTLVSKEGRGRSQSNDPFKRNKSIDKSKTRKDLSCYYCDKSVHIKKIVRSSKKT